MLLLPWFMLLFHSCVFFNWDSVFFCRLHGCKILVEWDFISGNNGCKIYSFFFCLEAWVVSVLQVIECFWCGVISCLLSAFASWLSCHLNFCNIILIHKLSFVVALIRLSRKQLTTLWFSFEALTTAIHERRCAFESS